MSDSEFVPLFSQTGDVCAYCIVDRHDLPLTVGHRLRMSSGGYAVWSDHGEVFLHREILGLPRRAGDLKTDHKNRNRLDNRRGNLRIATPGQNMQNKPSYIGAVSKYRGVWWEAKKGRWRSAVQVGGIRTRLGYFDSEEEANRAAISARRALMPFSEEGTYAVR